MFRFRSMFSKGEQMKKIEASVYVKEIPKWIDNLDAVCLADSILGEDYDWSHEHDGYPIEMKMTLEFVESRSCSQCYFNSGKRQCRIANFFEDEIDSFFCSHFERDKTTPLK